MQTDGTWCQVTVTISTANIRLTSPCLRVISDSLSTSELNRFQRPPSLRRGSAAGRLLGMWVRIPPDALMSVSCQCWELTGRGFCEGLITRPEESYWAWYIWVWSWSLDNDEALEHCGLSRSEEERRDKRKKLRRIQTNFLYISCVWKWQYNKCVLATSTVLTNKWIELSLDSQQYFKNINLVHVSGLKNINVGQLTNLCTSWLKL